MKALILAAAVLLTTEAAAQTPNEAPAPAAPAAAEAPAGTAQAARGERSGPNNDPSQVVCMVEAETGSRLGRKRVCRTRAEWALHQREVRERTERAQNQTQTQY